MLTINILKWCSINHQTFVMFEQVASQIGAGAQLVGLPAQASVVESESDTYAWKVIDELLTQDTVSPLAMELAAAGEVESPPDLEPLRSPAVAALPTSVVVPLNVHDVPDTPACAGDMSEHAGVSGQGRQKGAKNWSAADGVGTTFTCCLL